MPRYTLNTRIEFDAPSNHKAVERVRRLLPCDTDISIEFRLTRTILHDEHSPRIPDPRDLESPGGGS